MSKKAAEQLLNDAGDGTALRRELDQALGKGNDAERRDAFLSTAKRHGYEFTADEFEEAVAGVQATPAIQDLSDSDLDAVTGGVGGMPASNVDFGHLAAGAMREPRPGRPGGKPGPVRK